MYHISELDDMSNAFACTDQEELEEATEALFVEEDWAYIRQRIFNTVVRMEATDGKVEVLIKEGFAMGTCEAPKMFAIAFKEASFCMEHAGVEGGKTHVDEGEMDGEEGRLLHKGVC